MGMNAKAFVRIAHTDQALVQCCYLKVKLMGCVTKSKNKKKNYTPKECATYLRRVRVKMKVKAKKINNPNCDYLTEGKVYEPTDIFMDGFIVVDDVGGEIVCLYEDCPHIIGNWTIITDKAKVR